MVVLVVELRKQGIRNQKNEFPVVLNVIIHCSFHNSMRHTTATHMLEAGVPLIVLKNFLGHVSIQTTQIYAEVTQDTMNNKLKA